MEVLDVSLRYEFSISELFKMVVKKEDFEMTEKFCEAKNIAPEYVILCKKGLKLLKDFQLSFRNIFMSVNSKRVSRARKKKWI